MLAFVTVIHIVLAVFMIFVILLQPGKDAGMGSALGGGAATSAFGGRGAVTFLSKLTAACAVLFFLTSLGLSFVGLRASVTQRRQTPPATTAPATTTAPAAATTAPAAAPATSGLPASQSSAPKGFNLKPLEPSAPASTKP